MPRFPITFGLTLVLPTAVLAQQPTRYTLSDDPVAIYNLVGSVRVEPVEGTGVNVQVTRAGADAAQLRVVQGEIDGRSTLRVIYPGSEIRRRSGTGNSSTQLSVREDGTFGHGDHDHDHDHDEDGPRDGRRVRISSGAGVDARADLLVQVPRGRQVAVYLAVGSVAVSNVDGELTVDAHDASVSATAVKGRLSVDVGSGTVQVSQAEGELEVDSGSGPVEVSRYRGSLLSIDTGSGDVTGTDLESQELSIETGSGEIRVTGVSAPQLSLETGSGNITAELRRDVSVLHAETGSGDVAIRAPAALGAAVEIETSSGDIDTDFALQVTRRSRDHVVGTIGDGRGTIEIETGSGQITLLKGSN